MMILRATVDVVKLYEMQDLYDFSVARLFAYASVGSTTAASGKTEKSTSIYVVDKKVVGT